MNYPIKCPNCEITIDSHDSYADSKAELRAHIERNHPNAFAANHNAGRVEETPGQGSL